MGFRLALSDMFFLSPRPTAGLLQTSIATSSPAPKLFEQLIIVWKKVDILDFDYESLQRSVLIIVFTLAVVYLFGKRQMTIFEKQIRQVTRDVESRAKENEELKGHLSNFISLKSEVEILRLEVDTQRGVDQDEKLCLITSMKEILKTVKVRNHSLKSDDGFFEDIQSQQKTNMPRGLADNAMNDAVFQDSGMVDTGSRSRTNHIMSRSKTSSSDGGSIEAISLMEKSLERSEFSDDDEEEVGNDLEDNSGDMFFRDLAAPVPVTVSSKKNTSFADDNNDNAAENSDGSIPLVLPGLYPALHDAPDANKLLPRRAQWLPPIDTDTPHRASWINSSPILEDTQSSKMLLSSVNHGDDNHHCVRLKHSYASVGTGHRESPQALSLISAARLISGATTPTIPTIDDGSISSSDRSSDKNHGKRVGSGSENDLGKIVREFRRVRPGIGYDSSFSNSSTSSSNSLSAHDPPTPHTPARSSHSHPNPISVSLPLSPFSVHQQQQESPTLVEQMNIIRAQIKERWPDSSTHSSLSPRNENPHRRAWAGFGRGENWGNSYDKDVTTVSLKGRDDMGAWRAKRVGIEGRERSSSHPSQLIYESDSSALRPEHRNGSYSSGSGSSSGGNPYNRSSQRQSSLLYGREHGYDAHDGRSASVPFLVWVSDTKTWRLQDPAPRHSSSPQVHYPRPLGQSYPLRPTRPDELDPRNTAYRSPEQLEAVISRPSTSPEMSPEMAATLSSDCFLGRDCDEDGNDCEAATLHETATVPTIAESHQPRSLGTPRTLQSFDGNLPLLSHRSSNHSTTSFFTFPSPSPTEKSVPNTLKKARPASGGPNHDASYLRQRRWTMREILGIGRRRTVGGQGDGGSGGGDSRKRFSGKFF